MKCQWLAFLLFLGACDSAADPAPAPEAKTSAPAPTGETLELELTDAQRATLDAADLVDGAADKIVADCGRCALHMPGNEAHASHVGEYTLHFCAASCKEAFEADPAKGIAEIQGHLDQ